MANIDPRIALQTRGIEMPSPLESYGKAISLRSLIDAQSQKAQVAQEQNEVRQILKQAPNAEAALPLLMKAGTTGVQAASALVQMAKQSADAKAASEKQAFFSPENRQQYMTGARPEIALPENVEGPVSPAIPGKMDFNRFLQDAAAKGVVNPETYANHLAQREQARATQEATAQARRDALEARIMEIKTRAEDRTLDRQSREALAREAIQARREIVALTAAMRQPQRDRMQYDPSRGGMVNLDTGEFKPAVGPGGEPIGNKPTPEKAMPASAVRSLMENQQNLRRAEQALTLIQGAPGGDPNATGWKGLLSTTEVGDQVLQRVDPKGVSTRAAISDLGSMIIHDRSGAAVTAAEYPRLRPFIPKVTDNSATAKKKLQRFVTEYRHIQQESVDFFTESGYKVPVNSLRPPAAPNAGAIQPPQRRASDATDDPLGIRSQ